MSRLVPTNEHEEKKLLEDLKQALQDDKIYWVRNDAKIRASITSKNYDEFRDVVAAAHLKPLAKSDTSSKADLGWNKSASLTQKTANENE